MPAQGKVILLPGGSEGEESVAVQLKEHESGGTTVRIRIRSFLLEKEECGGTRFERVFLPGHGVTREPGRPALPVIGVPLLLEKGGSVLEIRRKERVFEDVFPSPFVTRPGRCTSGEWRRTCETKLYSSLEIFPEEPVATVQSGWIRRADALLLEVRPFRYEPAARRLWVAWELEIDLSSRLFREEPDRYRSSVFRALELSRFHSLSKPVREGEVAEHMLVIAHDSLTDTVAPLVEWKKKKGMKVTLAPLSVVGSDFFQVKKYIANAYANWSEPPVYVLLVGDGEGPGKVPYVPSPYGCASDFLYSVLDGDDLYSDVLVGRMSAHTPKEAEVQVEKVLWWEGKIESTGDSGWLSGSVCISSSEGYGESNDDFRSDIICGIQSNHGYSPVDKLYHSEGTDTASSVTSCIEQGRGWVTYLGHGSGHGWKTTVPPFSDGQVEALSNLFKAPFIVDVSCSNGEFDNSSADCFAEVWMKTGTPDALRGGVAIYSASAPTPWDEPAEMAIGMTTGLLEHGVYPWAGVAAAGRAYMMEMVPSGKLEEVSHQYVVFGDPSLHLRTHKAEALQVEHPEVMPVGGADLIVKVKKGGGLLEGATVAVTKGEELLAVGKTGMNGTVALWVDASEPGLLEVTAWGPDTLVYSGYVEVVVMGCGVLQVSPSPASCSSTLAISLYDADLNSPMQIDSVSVGYSSTSQQGTKVLVLSETGQDTGKFKGEVVLSTEAGAHELQVKHGDIVTVTYHEASCDAGVGEKSEDVFVDCAGPVVSDVEFSGVSAFGATVKFSTDEAAFGKVLSGESVPPTKGWKFPSGKFHEVVLLGLKPSTEYFIALEVADETGNVTVDDNSGAYYLFKTKECKPKCSGKQCGSDGCGGECGQCCEGQTCKGGICMGGPGCEISTEGGCGSCKCQDCVCGMDPYCCEVGWDELCIEECVWKCGGCDTGPDCFGKECGSNGCGGVCGVCPEGWTCTDSGQCVEYCEPTCEGKECGPDGCGGECGQCEKGAVCLEGVCHAPCWEIDFVGCCDGQVLHYCEGGFEFVLDCGKLGKECGWKDSMGWYECVEEQKGDPSGKHPIWCPGGCLPQCEGRNCGPEGCGGECGECGSGEKCLNAACEPVCTPQYDGMKCGTDRCGGVCEECPMSQICEAGRCNDPCETKCMGIECGPNGCDGVCGECAPGMECSQDFKCVAAREEPDVLPELLDENVLLATGKYTAGCSSTSSSPPFSLLPVVVAAALFMCRRRKGSKLRD